MLLSFLAGATCFLAGFLWTRLDLSWAMLPVLVIGTYLGLFAAVLLILAVLCAFVDMKKPQEKDSPFYRKVMGMCIDTLATLCRVRLHTEGMEKLPAQGRFLLVCNHQHIADPALLLHAFPNSQLAFISKKENGKLPIVNKLMHRTMCQMIDRENDRQALKVILQCIRMIKEDLVSVGVFPEGGIKEVGKLAHFRSGAFKIAQKAGVPIVVCTMKNTASILKNAAKLKPTDVQLHLLEVIAPEDLAGRTTVDIAQQVYERMIEDLGEDFRSTEDQNPIHT